MPVIVSILEIIELKNTLTEKFGASLHVHDGCSGQFFDLENTSPAANDYIVDYFNKKRYMVIFSENQEEFYLEDIRTC